MSAENVCRILGQITYSRRKVVSAVGLTDISFMSAENVCRILGQITYSRRKVVSAVGLHAPLPLIRHLGPSYGLDAPPDLGLVQLNSAHPSGIKWATHVADLVDSGLKWVDSAADECPQQVIYRHSCSFQLLDNLVDGVDLQHLLLRVVTPVKLCCGGPIANLGRLIRSTFVVFFT